MSGEVIGIDGLTDQQREGARLAAAGWRGVDIADHLGIAQETVSRWRKKPEYVAAIEAIFAETRAEVAGRMSELTNKALDVLDEMLDYRYDPALKLRAASTVLQISGVARALSAGASAGSKGETGTLVSQLKARAEGRGKREWCRVAVRPAWQPCLLDINGGRPSGPAGVLRESVLHGADLSGLRATGAP